VFEYQMQKLRQDELIKEADAHRLVRQALRARRAGRSNARTTGKGRVSPPDTGHYTRAA
jgi:hypothetical protein